jgi:hypothetical protein
MSAQQMIDELRARALRYRILAGGLDDRQTAAEVRQTYGPVPTNSKRKLSDWQIRASH